MRDFMWTHMLNVVATVPGAVAATALTNLSTVAICIAIIGTIALITLLSPHL